MAKLSASQVLQRAETRSAPTHRDLFHAIRDHYLKAERTDLPKYQALRDAILEAIAASEWNSGMRLPTEAELCRFLPCGLATVQKAYAQLVRDRIVVRSRGKGSFLAGGSQALTHPWHCRFLDDANEILPVRARLLGHTKVGDEWEGRAIFQHDREIIRIDRLLTIGGEFAVLSRFYSNAGVARAILDRPWSQFQSANFKATLLRELGIPIVRIRQTLSTPNLRARRSIGFDFRAHLLLKATAFTARQEIAYYQELFIEPNKRELLFDTEFHL